MRAGLGDRSLFPDLEAAVYLAHSAISPPSSLVRQRALEAVDHYARHGLYAWMDYCEQRDRLRARLGDLVGVRAEDVALVANTSFGVQAVATCMPWRAGDRVLCFEGEFPTNVTPWQQAAAQWDLRLDLRPLEPFHRGVEEGLASVEGALKDGVRLVAVSLVQFQTGLRMPVEELGALCHRHGARLFVDAIQGVGVLPLDQVMQHVDYLSAGSHKWLMGLEGLAFLAVHPAVQEDWQPRLAAWLSHEDATRFLFEGEGHLRYDRPFRRAPGQLEAGAANVVGCAALEGAVELLAQLGAPAIHAHVQAWHDAVEPQLLQRGFTSLRGGDPRQRSGILALRPPATEPEIDWPGALRERGVATTMPDGCLRLAPHWPNSLDEAGPLLAAVDAILAGD